MPQRSPGQTVIDPAASLFVGHEPSHTTGTNSAGSSAVGSSAVGSGGGTSTSASSISAANAAGIFAEGSRFGPYVIGPCIGHGETARVYRAEHEAIPIGLALEVFTNEFARSTVGRNRFLREARRAATIRHPSVVNIFDVGVQDGIPYLVMERLDGEDLDALLRSRGALDESTIVDLMVPVVAGLCALHEAGLVHGDLAASNIFLANRAGREREPKLLDCGISRAFGGARLRRSSGTRGMLRGSPLYLAPEAASGGEVTPLSDQYSLGVLLYECAVGAHPFMADTAAESVHRITHGEYPALSQHEARPSTALVHVIERAMSLDPEERFPDLKALGRELLLLASERTRMTWSLSFGEAGPVLLTRRKAAAPPAPLRLLGELFDRERLRRFDWSTAAAILFGLVTFSWGIAILLGR